MNKIVLELKDSDAMRAILRDLAKTAQDRAESTKSLRFPPGMAGATRDIENAYHSFAIAVTEQVK